MLFTYFRYRYPFVVCKYTKIPNTSKQNARKIAQMLKKRQTPRKRAVLLRGVLAFMSGTRPLAGASSLIHQPSFFHLTSYILHRSAFSHHTSTIYHLPSYFFHLTSSILLHKTHQPSAITHQPSIIFPLTSSILHLPSYFIKHISLQPSNISHRQVLMFVSLALAFSTIDYC